MKDMTPVPMEIEIAAQDAVGVREHVLNVAVVVISGLTISPTNNLKMETTSVLIAVTSRSSRTVSRDEVPKVRERDASRV
jgi:hypothetical protein